MKRLLHYQTLAFITHGKTKSSYNKFKISAPTWNKEFTLPDGSYSLYNIQGYFEYILKKHRENTDEPPIQIYINNIENRITFKIKNDHSLELLTKETVIF